MMDCNALHMVLHAFRDGLELARLLEVDHLIVEGGRFGQVTKARWADEKTEFSSRRVPWIDLLV